MFQKTYYFMNSSNNIFYEKANGSNGNYNFLNLL